MQKLFSSRLFVAGFLLAVLGALPLTGIILLAGLGLWPDPDPNPIGPGLLCFVTFWPGILLMIAGALRVRSRS